MMLLARPLPPFMDYSFVQKQSDELQERRALSGDPKRLSLLQPPSDVRTRCVLRSVTQHQVHSSKLVAGWGRVFHPLAGITGCMG